MTITNRLTVIRGITVIGLYLASTMLHADTANAPVVVSGTVPTDADKQLILAKVRALYGDRVVDQIKLGNVRTPPNWTQTVVNNIQPALKDITQGRLSINGPNIGLYGNVTSDTTKRALATTIGQGLPAAYNVTNSLEVVVAEQAIVDKALANRIIEFESGSAKITPAGTAILDEIAVALAKVQGKSVKIIGHTDNLGNAAANQKLSLDRAEAVKTYLTSKGQPAASMSTQGMGAAKPVAKNDTDEGRRRNRRIEFDVL